MAWNSIEEPVGTLPVVLKGELATAPRGWRAARQRPFRVRLVAFIERAVSVSFSAVVHLLLLILMAQLLYFVVPVVEESIVAVGLARDRVPEPEPKKEPKKEIPQPVVKEADPVPEKPPAEPKPVETKKKPAPIGVKKTHVVATRIEPDFQRIPEFFGEDFADPSGGNVYSNREKLTRDGARRKYGGTVASELAVESALEWLAKHQDVSGRWSPKLYQQHCPESDKCGLVGSSQHLAPGVTGLAVLAYLGAGYTHKKGKYRDVVARGLRYLTRVQDKRGVVHDPPSQSYNMYMHGVATFALGEAYAMTKDEKLLKSLKRAVEVIAARQTESGGWYYSVKGKTQAETTLSVWQMMALKSAMDAGVEVPDEVIEKAKKYITDATHESGGVHYYWEEDGAFSNVTAGSTAASLFARVMFGLDREEAFQKGLDYLDKNFQGYFPKTTRARKWEYLYFWYYMTLVNFQVQGTQWWEWNRNLRRYLVANQVREGHATGTWEAIDYVHLGTVYSTAMGALMLEVYYRYLPMYKRGDTVDKIVSASVESRDDRSKLEKEMEREKLPEHIRKEIEAKERAQEIEELKGFLGSENEFKRWMAVKRLCELKAKTLMPKVAKLVDRETGKTKSLMLKYLGESNDPQVNWVLIRNVDSSDPKIRLTAIRSLNRINKVYLTSPEEWKNWWKDRQGDK